MATPALRANVRATIEARTPEVTSGKAFFLKSGELLSFGVGFAQKVCLLQKSGHIIPHLSGQLLDLAVGDNKKVQKAASMILGAKAITQCTSDILQLKWLGQRLIGLFKGQSYVVVKQDHWDCRSLAGRLSPSMQDKWRWFFTVVMEQIKHIFITIGLIFKRLLMLALHLSDAYKACSGNCVPGVFINAKALWDEISSDKSALVKQWKKNKTILEWMIKQKQLGNEVKGTASEWKLFLAKLELLPNTFRKIPELIVRGAKWIKKKFIQFVKMIENIGHRFKKFLTKTLIKTRLIYKIPAALVPTWEAKCKPFKPYTDKSKRFIEPPVRRVV